MVFLSVRQLEAIQTYRLLVMALLMLLFGPTQVKQKGTDCNSSFMS